jgi:hypothetical protein
MEMTMEAIIAVQKESILKPETIFEVIIRIIAFMTKVNSPKVRIVAGSVRSVRIGLRVMFSKARIMAIIIAERKESTWNPGTR